MWRCSSTVNVKILRQQEDSREAHGGGAWCWKGGVTLRCGPQASWRTARMVIVKACHSWNLLFVSLLTMIKMSSAASQQVWSSYWLFESMLTFKNFISSDKMGKTLLEFINRWKNLGDVNVKVLEHLRTRDTLCLHVFEVIEQLSSVLWSSALTLFNFHLQSARNFKPHRSSTSFQDRVCFLCGSGGAATAALTHFMFTLGESHHVTFATGEPYYAGFS